MNHTIIGTTIAMLTLIGSLCFAQTKEPIHVYVADFTSETADQPLLRSLTRDVDSLVSQSNRYVLLERSEVNRLSKELQNEADLTRDPALRSRLRLLSADAVIFGRVEDDVKSGEYLFYLSLVMLDGSKAWARNAPLKRGLIGDRDSRLRVLLSLIEPAAGNPTSVRPAPKRAPTALSPRHSLFDSQGDEDVKLLQNSSIAEVNCSPHATLSDGASSPRDITFALRSSSQQCVLGGMGKGLVIDIDLCRDRALGGIRIGRRSVNPDGVDAASLPKLTAHLTASDGSAIADVGFPISSGPVERNFPMLWASKIRINVPITVSGSNGPSTEELCFIDVQVFDN